MFRSNPNRLFAFFSALFGAAYLAVNNLLPGLLDFFMGLLIGLSILFLLFSLFQSEVLQKIREWKHRG